jgi:hypothetical protein
MAEASCWSRADGWVDSLAYPGYALDYRYGSMWSLYNVYGSLAAMRVTLDFYDEHEWLISPLITVNDSAKLSFDIRMTRGMGESSPDSLSDETRFGVAFTADDGTSWQVLADWGGAAGGNLMQSMDSLNWHPSITLPAEAMGNIRLGFFVETGLNTDNVYLHLDNVKVELDSARIPPVLDTFTVYINRVCRSCGENIPADYVVGEGRYVEGDTVRLEGLVQGEGVSFDFWILETGDTIFDNPYSFVIHSDRIITAYFSQNVGIDDVEGSDFLIYPNPATTTVTIVLDESMDANTSLQVLDQQGRVVYECRQDAGAPLTIDVSRWAAGTYFVRIVNDSGAIVKKLILR